MQDVFKRIDDLSPKKRALLLKKIALPQKQAQPLLTNVRDPSQNMAPLSLVQEQLWLLDQIEQGIAAYHVPLTLRLQGKLSIPALQASLTTIIARHESLRTTFQLLEGQPMQIIAPARPCSLSVIDLQNLPVAEREGALRTLAECEALCPFNLTTGPLLHTLLICLGPHEHALLIFMHHIIADGLSARLLWQELCTLYPSLCTGTPASLPVLSLQYADFALWQRSSRFMEADLAYWQKQLADVLPLELPADYARPSHQTFNGQHLSLQMPPALSQRFKLFAQNERMTLFMALVASFSILLGRYSNQNDIAIGTPTTMRADPRLEPLIGLFVNTLVLRIQIPAPLSCRVFFQQVRQVILEAYKHQDIPLSKIIELVQPQRDPSRSPLFQALFSLQDAQPGYPTLGELAVSLLEYQNPTTKYDLSASIIDSPQGFLAIFEYNSDLFAATTIQPMLHHWQRILEEIVLDPEQNVWELPLLSLSERTHMLFDWNNTTTTQPSLLLHELFEAQVGRTPDARALLFEDQAFTYRELNNSANQVALALQKRGIGMDMLVGLYIERSPEMLIGVFGILKVGAAYIPLDPNYPAQRLTFMIQHAQPALLLTTKDFYTSLFHIDIDLLCLDEKGFLRSDKTVANPQSSVHDTNLAYMIYTSGSTGIPKGIAVSHQAVQNLCYAMMALFPLRMQDTMFAVTSLSFDISILELFVPLAQGATVHLAPEDAVADGPRLIGLLEQEQAPASIMQATPVTWQLLLAHGWSGHRDMRIICGGEPLSSTLAHALLSRGKELWNMYGPTETTVWSTAARISQEMNPISIGNPIANTSVYILDNYFQPVPVGVTGELWIGGIGLARGYTGQLDLTAERFRPNPFSEHMGERIYRTGDLARYHPDGIIECLGRIDHQVKIHGFRIELEEIETILQQYSAVQACVVTLQKEHPDQPRIIAYLKLYVNVPFALEDLYTYLQEYLPAYMLPSAVVTLDEFPLTPNKKIDRQRLPTSNLVFFDYRSEYVAPASELEQQLVQIWQEVLGVEKIGIQDDFFMLGGDSLSSILMMNKARESGLDLSVKNLNRARTIKQLAKLMVPVEEDIRILSSDGAQKREGALCKPFNSRKAI